MTKKKKKSKLKINPSCKLEDTDDFKSECISDNDFVWETPGKLKLHDGIIFQMEKASTIRSTVLTNEELVKTFEELRRTSSLHTYPTSWRPTIYGTPMYTGTDGITTDIKEEIEKGIKSQILFGAEGYEIVDGNITRVLTFEEIQKLKDEKI